MLVPRWPELCVTLSHSIQLGTTQPQVHRTMNAYLDNNVVSAILKDDIASESAAIDRLLEMHHQGVVSLVTSEITLAEMTNAPEPYVPRLRRAYHLLKNIPVVSWNKLSHMQRTGRPGGSQVIWPVFENEPLFSQLLSTGLTNVDAQHLFVAAKQSCQAFITCDNSPKTSVLARAREIYSLCGVTVQRPSEFIAAHG
jgi:hypothetical protein